MYREGVKKVKIRIQLTAAEVSQAICMWLNSHDAITEEEMTKADVHVMDDSEYAQGDAPSRVYVEVARVVD